MNYVKSFAKKSVEKCYICGKLCDNRRILSHIRTHTNVEVHECQDCGSRFASKRSLRQHYLTHTTHDTCKACNKKFNDPNSLAQHRCIEAKEKKHFCKTCGKRFFQISGLTRHTVTHLAEKPFACDVCDKRFFQKGHLTVHYAKYNNNKYVQTVKPKPYKCKLCSKSFSLKGNLKRHFISHSKEKPFPCEICSKSFAYKDHLKAHLRLHTNDVKLYHCEYCNKIFNRKFNLKVHYEMHKRKESGEPAPKREQKSMFTCKLCFKSFPSNRNLERHQISHTDEKPYVCELCGKSFAYKSYLKVHKLHHTSEKKFKCDECGKCYYDKRVLNQHIKRHKPPTIRCSVCGKGFYAPAEYDRHYIIHANVKPYVCDICHKGFSQCGHLKKHYICHVKKKDQYIKQKEKDFNNSVNELEESGNKKICKKVAENIYLINKQVRSFDNLINGVNENCDDDLITELNENCDDDLNELNENCDDDLINELDENCDDDLTNELEGNCGDLANVQNTNCDDNQTNEQNINCEDNIANKFEENLCKNNSKYELEIKYSNDIVRNYLLRKDCNKDVLTVYDQIKNENIFNISKELPNVHDDDILDVKLNKSPFIKAYDFNELSCAIPFRCNLCKQSFICKKEYEKHISGLFCLSNSDCNLKRIINENKLIPSSFSTGKPFICILKRES